MNAYSKFVIRDLFVRASARRQGGCRGGVGPMPRVFVSTLTPGVFRGVRSVSRRGLWSRTR